MQHPATTETEEVIFDEERDGLPPCIDDHQDGEYHDSSPASWGVTNRVIGLVLASLMLSGCYTKDTGMPLPVFVALVMTLGSLAIFTLAIGIAKPTPMTRQPRVDIDLQEDREDDVMVPFPSATSDHVMIPASQARQMHARRKRAEAPLPYPPLMPVQIQAKLEGLRKRLRVYALTK